jgi:hypothetical protein
MESNLHEMMNAIYMMQYLVDLHAQYIEKYGKDVMFWPPEALQKYAVLLGGINR